MRDRLRTISDRADCFPREVPQSIARAWVGSAAPGATEQLRADRRQRQATLEGNDDGEA